MDNKKLFIQKKWIKVLGVAAVWLILWQLAALWIGNEILFAGPVKTIRHLAGLVVTGGFWQTCLFSLLRILAGFLLALVCGCLLGLASLKWSLFESLISPFLLFCKAVPVASFAVMLLIWWGAGWLSLAICFLVTVPLVYVNFVEGMRSVDGKMLQMAKVFRISRRGKFFSIYRPALAPFMEGCFKTALSMGIKAGVAAEVIGISDWSIGGEIYLSKIYLDTAGVFSWTIVVIALSFGLEKGLLWLWKRFCGLQIKVPVKKQDAQAKTCGVTISGLCKAFGEQVVLKNISATLTDGEVYCLMAPSGAGKTTLLHILAGLVKQDGGSVKVNGDGGSVKENGNTGAKAAMQPAMFFQEDRLCEEESALQNVMLTGCGRQAAEECLGKLLPEDALEKAVKSLSGGMRRRVCIARALVSEGNVLLLDEPFTGLDEVTKQAVQQIILEYRKNRLTILVTHDEKDIEKMQGQIWRLTPQR